MCVHLVASSLPSDRSARFYKRVLRHKKLSFRSLGQLKKRVAPAPPSQEEVLPFAPPFF